MTRAVLLALAPSAEGSPACALEVEGVPIIRRLSQQLEQHAVSVQAVITRPEWIEELRDLSGLDVHGSDGLVDSLAFLEGCIGGSREGLLLASADIVTHDGAISGLLADPRVTSGILATTGDAGKVQTLRVRITRGRVVAAESAFHSVTSGPHRFLEMLKIGPEDLDDAAEVLRTLSPLVEPPLPEGWDEALREKVVEWGHDVLYDVDEEGNRSLSPRTLLPALLPEDDPRPWVPDAKRLREDLEEEFHRRVIVTAETYRADPVPLLLVGLIRREVVLSAAYLRELFWDRPSTQGESDEAALGLRLVDEDRAQLNSAVKASDGFFTTFFVSTYSRYIARWAARRGLTPNQVTTFSMFLGILAAAAFAVGTQPWAIVGAVVLQFAFTADCVDGQLARYSRQFSKLGAWLDSVFDRGKEYVVYAGLALGATRAGEGEGIWVLAAAALALMTFRHFVDFSYAGQQHLALSETVAAPLEDPLEAELSPWEALDEEQRRSPLRTLARAGVKASHAAERTAWMKWAKRAFVLPIGERFALISITAAVAGPRATFLALLIWGSAAATYTITGRIARSFA